MPEDPKIEDVSFQDGIMAPGVIEIPEGYDLALECTSNGSEVHAFVFEEGRRNTHWGASASIRLSNGQFHIFSFPPARYEIESWDVDGKDGYILAILMERPGFNETDDRSLQEDEDL